MIHLMWIVILALIPDSSTAEVESCTVQYKHHSQEYPICIIGIIREKEIGEIVSKFDLNRSINERILEIKSTSGNSVKVIKGHYLGPDHASGSTYDCVINNEGWRCVRVSHWVA